MSRKDKNTKGNDDNQETKRNKLVGRDFFFNGILRLSAFLGPFTVFRGELTWNKQVIESNVVSCMQMMSWLGSRQC